MAKIRVYELARRYKLTSKGLIELLRGIGIHVDHHMSGLDERQVETARKLLERIKRGQEPLVFLCYSNKDLEFMHKLRRDLERAEFTVWTAEGIPPGTSIWTRAIEEAITKCRAVVVILSENAKKSEWVEREIHYALEQKKPLIPVLAKDDPVRAIPLALAGNQWIDAKRGKYQTGARRLIRALRHHVGA